MRSAQTRKGLLPDTEASPFMALLRFELGQSFRQRHAITLVSMVAMGWLLALWLPTFPQSVFRFFQHVFQLDTWPDIVFANELAGLFFFIYWIAVFDVLTIYIVPLEERQLDLYLSKPLPRRTYMLARLLPILLIVIGIYTVSVAAHWLALGTAGLAYPAAPLIGAAAAVLGWTLLLASIVNLAILNARETYVALLIAFIPMAISIMPGMIYMYRPDLFVDAPNIRDLIVFPLNLIWHQDFSAVWGLWLAALFIALAIAIAGASGWRIEQRDVK